MRTLVVANWKMNPATFKEAKRLFEATKKTAEICKSIAVVIAPPPIFLRELAAGYRGKAVVFGAQDARAEKNGAHTGGVSVLQVKNSKGAYVIVGHSERRAEGETDADIRGRVTAVLSAKMTPILCVGETKRSSSGEHFNVVQEQLREGLADVPQSLIRRVIIAYEPVWAIGGEVSMSPHDMHEMAIFIRKTVVSVHGVLGMGIRIIYGGAVSEENARAMLAGGDVTGLLVGHVSIDAQRFASLLESLEYST